MFWVVLRLEQSDLICENWVLIFQDYLSGTH